MRARRSSGLSGIVTYALIALAVVFAIGPIIWLVTSSLKPTNEIYRVPPRLLSSRWTLEHFQKVLGDRRMLRYFFNSLAVSGLTTILSSCVGVLCAYAFSRFRFRMRRALYLFVLGTRMLPIVVLILPLYFLFIVTGLVDTYLGLVLAYLTRVLPLSIWLFTSFMQKIPLELDEVAMIDGCSRVQVLVRVILPNLGPASLAVGIYTFLMCWNEYLIPLILVSSESLRPVSVGLSLYITEFQVSWGSLLGAAVLITVGPMVVYSVFHRLLSFGLSEGSLKG